MGSAAGAVLRRSGGRSSGCTMTGPHGPKSSEYRVVAAWNRVTQERQDPMFSEFARPVLAPQAQFIKEVVDTAVVAPRQDPVSQRLQNTVLAPQAQFTDGAVDIRVGATDQVSQCTLHTRRRKPHKPQFIDRTPCPRDATPGSREQESTRRHELDASAVCGPRMLMSFFAMRVRLTDEESSHEHMAG